jgi:hypothetical protein
MQSCCQFRRMILHDPDALMHRLLQNVRPLGGAHRPSLSPLPLVELQDASISAIRALLMDWSYYMLLVVPEFNPIDMTSDTLRY